jgi:hypothetical protein
VRRKVGASLAFVGGFLVILAILAQVYAPGQLMKTPLDIDNTTHLSGVAQLSDGSDLVSYDVKAVSVTHTDSAKSDDDVAVWVNSSCLVKDEGDVGDCVSADDPGDRLISASTDNFATDRVTGLAVNDPKYLPADAAPHEGLINKWPFESEKKTYPYWSDDLGTTIDAVYDRTETLEGIECYVYKATITDADVDVAEGVPGILSSVSEIYVEPLTGAIQNQVEHREQSMADGTPVIILDLAFTDAQAKASADDVATKVTLLNLLMNTVPLVGYLVGVPMLIVGLALLFLNRKDPETPEAKTKEPVAAGAK